MGKRDSDISKMLSELRENTSSGANELVFKAPEIIRSQLNLVKNPNENVRKIIIDLAEEIINTRPSMAPLINAMGYIINDSEFINKKSIIERLEQFEKEKIAKNKVLGENFQEFLRKYQESDCKIMLISYSSTIIKLLSKFNKYSLEIYVLESRPLLEGQKTAEILSQWFKTHLIIDAAIGKFIDQIDFVLIGADSILKDGSIINKIGTFPLAIVANANNVDVYAVADSYKYNLRSHFGEPILIEKKPSNEIYNKELINDFLEVHNYYFDITHPRYISGIISNLGILNIQDFLEKVQHDLPIEWFKYFLNNKRV